MVKLEERSDGYFILEINLGYIVIKKIFKEMDIPMSEVSNEPKSDGFYLNIPFPEINEK